MTSSPPSDPSWRRRVPWTLLLAALVVESLYVFVISAGHGKPWPFYLHYVDDLAEGFRQGHLHLSVEPPAALLARPNPLAPENHDLWYWDVSLYKGHYYLYWGPVPALLLALAKTLFRVQGVVGDDVVVFALATLQLAAGTWLVARAARTFFGRASFDRPPVTLQVLAVFAIGLANPTPYNLARPAVYEAAIVGAQAFLLLGMAFAFEAVSRPTPRRWLIASGAAWALAVGCRASVAPAVALLAGLAAWHARPAAAAGTQSWLRRAAPAFAAVALPLALGVFALLAYNRLRFESWLEFGRRFQLSWIDAPAAARFVAPNLYAYLLRPPALSCRFPYVFALANMGARAFPSWYQPPPGYFVYEQVVGFLVAVPCSWTAPVGWVAAFADWRRGHQMTDRAWAVLMATIAASAPIAAPMFIASATNRYLGDVVGGTVLCGVFGGWILYAAVRRDPARRRAALAAAAALAGLSIAIGLGLGFYGQYGQFPANNPALTDQLVRKLSVCGPVVPPPPN
ncbi:MAG TPA: hypothetical protein VHO67_11845 [Polyangia bacterium]|nr:hypothetical protein [Polyangia bacterium]